MSDGPEDAETLDERKHRLEREKFEHARDFDQRRLSSEHFTRMASSFSIVIPLLLLLLNNFVSSYQERQTRLRATEQARVQLRIEDDKARLARIDLQISKLYSPLKGKLDRDKDIWQFYKKNQSSPDPLKKNVSRVVEQEYMIPNYAAITSVVEDNFDLIRIESEDQASYQNFIEAVNAYEQYVLVLSVMRRNSPGATLAGLDDGFPSKLVPEVNRRLDLLFAHRKTIADEVNRLRTEVK